MKEAEFICGYVLEFSDGGEPEEQILGHGTREECERLGDLLPAVCYSGSRPDPQCHFVVVEAPRG